MDELAIIDDAPTLVVRRELPTRSWPRWALVALLLTAVGVAVWFWQRRSAANELAERRQYATALGQHAAPQPAEPPSEVAEVPGGADEAAS